MKHFVKIVITSFFVLSIGIIISILSSYHNLKVNHYIYNAPDRVLEDSLRLVVLADLHDHEFGPANQKLVDKVLEQSPDVILIVGDLLNRDSEDAEVPCTLIGQLAKQVPVYMVLGNHELEYMAGHPELISQLEAEGAVVLEKEYVDTNLNGADVRIGGTFDYAFALDGNDDASTLQGQTKAFLEEFQNTDDLKIMMCHRPDSFCFGNAAEYWDVDLVIAAHNHGGQVVLPFLGGLYGGDQGWFPEYVHGMHEIGNIEMFITSGLGSNPKILPRFNNRPEIAVIDVQPQ